MDNDHSTPASPRENSRPQHRPPSPPSPPAFENRAYLHDEADQNHNDSFTSTHQNGHSKEPNGQANGTKTPEAVNLELINLTPKNGNAKKKDVEVEINARNTTNPYEEYFVPVNEHRKRMRGEKLYVTADKRGEKSKCKRPLCWTLLALVIAAIVALIVLAATGVLFANSPTEVNQYNSSVSSARAFGGFGSVPAHDHNHNQDHDHDHEHEHDAHDHSHHDHDHSDHTNQETQNDQSEENNVSMHVPETLEGEIKINNMEFTDQLNDRNSEEYRQIASEIARNMKNILENAAKDGMTDVGDIRVEVVQLKKGSVVVTFRVHWTKKNDSMTSQNPITATTLKRDLQNYLESHNSMISSYSVAEDYISINQVTDLCQSDLNGCEYGCIFDKTTLNFLCTCPDGQILDISNPKRCVYESDIRKEYRGLDLSRRFEHPHLIPQSEPTTEPNAEPEPEPTTEPKAEPEPSPEPNVEPKLTTETQAEPEPNAEPKAEPEPTAEPKAEPETTTEPKVQPEPSAEPKVEPEPNAEPEPTAEPKAEPEPTAEPKVEPEPSTESKMELEPNAESEPTAEPKAEPEPTAEPKVEPEPTTELKVELEPTVEYKVEPEPTAEPKVEPEPTAEPKVEPEPTAEPKVEPEPTAEPKVEPEPTVEPKLEPEQTAEPKVEPEPTAEPKVEPEPTAEPNAEPEPSTEPNAEPEPTEESKVKPEPTTESQAKLDTNAEPDVKLEASAKPKLELESTTESQGEPKTTSEPKVVPETTTEHKAEAEPTAAPKVEQDRTTELKTELEPNSESKAESERTAEPKTEPNPSAEPISEANAKPESTAEPKTEPEPTAEPKIEPELISESKAEPTIGSNIEPEADTVSKAKLELTVVPKTEAEPIMEKELDAETKTEPTTEFMVEQESTANVDHKMIWESTTENKPEHIVENAILESHEHEITDRNLRLQTSSAEPETSVKTELSIENAITSKPAHIVDTTTKDLFIESAPRTNPTTEPKSEMNTQPQVSSSTELQTQEKSKSEQDRSTRFLIQPIGELTGNVSDIVPETEHTTKSEPSENSGKDIPTEYSISYEPSSTFSDHGDHKETTTESEWIQDVSQNENLTHMEQTSQSAQKESEKPLHSNGKDLSESQKDNSIEERRSFDFDTDPVQYITTVKTSEQVTESFINAGDIHAIKTNEPNSLTTEQTHIESYNADNEISINRSSKSIEDGNTEKVIFVNKSETTATESDWLSASVSNIINNGAITNTEQTTSTDMREKQRSTENNYEKGLLMENISNEITTAPSQAEPTTVSEYIYKMAATTEVINKQQSNDKFENPAPVWEEPVESSLTESHPTQKSTESKPEMIDNTTASPETIVSSSVLKDIVKNEEIKENENKNRNQNTINVKIYEKPPSDENESQKLAVAHSAEYVDQEKEHNPFLPEAENNHLLVQKLQEEGHDLEPNMNETQNDSTDEHSAITTDLRASNAERNANEEIHTITEQTSMQNDMKDTSNSGTTTINTNVAQSESVVPLVTFFTDTDDLNVTKGYMSKSGLVETTTLSEKRTESNTSTDKALSVVPITEGKLEEKQTLKKNYKSDNSIQDLNDIE